MLCVTAQRETEFGARRIVHRNEDAAVSNYLGVFLNNYPHLKPRTGDARDETGLIPDEIADIRGFPGTPHLIARDVGIRAVSEYGIDVVER